MKIDKKIIAPISEGEKVGLVEVIYKDEPITTKNLIALKTVNKGNFFRRLVDNLLLLMDKSGE